MNSLKVRNVSCVYVSIFILEISKFGKEKAAMNLKESREEHMGGGLGGRKGQGEMS